METQRSPPNVAGVRHRQGGGRVPPLHQRPDLVGGSRLPSPSSFPPPRALPRNQASKATFDAGHGAATLLLPPRPLPTNTKGKEGG